MTTGNEWKRALDHHSTVKALTETLDGISEFPKLDAEQIAAGLARQGLALVSLAGPQDGTIDNTLKAEAEANWFGEEPA